MLIRILFMTKVLISLSSYALHSPACSNSRSRSSCSSCSRRAEVTPRGVLGAIIDEENSRVSSPATALEDDDDDDKDELISTSRVLVESRNLL